MKTLSSVHFPVSGNADLPEKSSEKGSSSITPVRALFPLVFCEAPAETEIFEYRPVTSSWADAAWINNENKNENIKTSFMVYWPDVGVAAAGRGIVSEIINIVESTGSFVESIVNQRYTAEPSCSDDSSENSGFCLYTKAFAESL